MKLAGMVRERPISVAEARSGAGADGSTHLLRSKAQWEKTKCKGCCQCHACGEREGQGKNCGYRHGNHPSSAMFGACDDLVGSSIVKSKQTIAIAAKYPIRSAAIVISSAPVWNDAQEKAVPYVTTEIAGEMELFPAHKWPSATSKRTLYLSRT
jgi:hypothetical protein